ncbi:MAG: hypothetical protein ACI9DJ_000801, partial [Algoriphagus sp.]
MILRLNQNDFLTIMKLFELKPYKTHQNQYWQEIPLFVSL